MQKTQNVIQNTFSVFLAIFLLYIIFLILGRMEPYTGRSYWLVLFLIALVVVFIICFFLGKQTNKYLDIIVIILVALIPRIIFATQHDYVPFNDFQNYMNAGINALDGRWLGGTAQDEVISSVQGFLTSPFYGKAFYGVPFFYACIAAIFTPTVLGFQIGFSVITTIGIVLIYLIGAQFQRKVGILAALLYGIYPAAIISAQVPTNQHFSLVFTLAAIYVTLLAVKNIEKNSRRALFQSVGAGLLILCAQSVLPSSPVVILAIVIFLTLKLIFNTKGIKNKSIVGCMIAIIIAVIYAGQIVCMTAVSNAGLISNYKLGETTSYKSKIAVGLNPDTYGASSEEYAEFRKIEDMEERETYIDQLIKKRLSDVPQLLNTLKNKARIMWAEPDAMNWWFTYQKITDLNTRTEKGETLTEEEQRYVQEYDKSSNFAATADRIMLIFIYSMAAICLFRQKRSIGDDPFCLLLLFVLGWIAAYLLIEIQTRHRYMAMPFLFIFAAMGIYTVCDLGKKLRQHALKKSFEH